MFNLGPIFAGILGSLFANSIVEKQRNSLKNVQPENVQPVQYIPAENPRNYRFAFSEETVNEKMGRIAERFKLRMYIEKRPYKLLSCSKSSSEIFMYRISLMGKYSFFVEIDFGDISIRFEDWDQKSFVLCDKSVGGFRAYMDDIYFYDEEDVVFPCEISAEDLSDDEIFDIVEKIIEAIYGANSMEYKIIKADDGNESFVFYLDAPDYYGYTETTEIGNFKFILNKENGGN